MAAQRYLGQATVAPSNRNARRRLALATECGRCVQLWQSP